MKNYSAELSKLISYMSNIAVQIRMRSAYAGVNSGNFTNEMSHEIMWYSDALHHFERFFDVVQSGSDDAVSALCDQLINVFNDYSIEHVGGFYKSQPKDAFENIPANCSPSAAIAILKSIKEKALSNLDPNPQTMHETLNLIMANHKFNVATLAAHEIHALCFNALCSQSEI